MTFAGRAVLDDDKLYKCYSLCTKMERQDKTSENLKTDSFDIFGLDLLTGDVQSNAYVYKPCEGDEETDAVAGSTRRQQFQQKPSRTRGA